MFEPLNDYLFVRLADTPTRGTMLSVPMADKALSFAIVVAGNSELKGKGVLFDNRGLKAVWIGNRKHCFIKKDEIISLWSDDDGLVNMIEELKNR